MNLESARELLIRHSRAPKNVETKGVSGHFGECRNPICGDHVQLWIKVENDVIASCQMQPRGCTMCVASASMMSEAMIGQKLSSARTSCQLFEQSLLDLPESEWPQELGSLEAFAHLRVNRMRIPCALIPWHALKNALMSATTSSS